MARAMFVNKARKPIYKYGRTVTYPGKKGTKREGRTMSKLDRTLPRDKHDEIIIQPGESYYWWQFMHGPVHYSKSRPKRSQLTQSDFLCWLYDFQDETINNLAAPEADEEMKEYSSDDLKTIRDEWIQEIEEKRDECQEKLDAMPESLQDTSSSGQLLTERIEGLDSWISDLESADLDWDDAELRSEAEQEWELIHTQALKEDDPDADEGKEEYIEMKFLELKREKVEELIGELQGFDPGIG